MTLPQGDVPAFQPAGDVVRTGSTGDPGSAFIFQIAEQPRLVFFPFPVEVGDEVVDAASISI